MTRILHVVGARPNFMKVAPIMREMARYPADFEQLLVHTGQHYDESMSASFFDELDLPRPAVNLEVGSGSHAWQTAQVLMRIEPVLEHYRPDWVLVPGDVNSTLAAALAASKLQIRVAHVEAGLRSLDRSMPEELNRLLTDQLADLLFTPSHDADDNLLREGVEPAKIKFVGNVMIDTLVRLLPRARERWSSLASRFELGRFMLVTLHRPSTVDEPEALRELLVALESIGRDLQVVFPVHPRTRARLAARGADSLEGVHLIDPIGYLDFLALQERATLVLTDSGGIQEETTFLAVPCLTARPNTERPITLTEGTNSLVATEHEAIVRAVHGVLANGKPAHTSIPELWDGRAAKRIVRVLAAR
jgi:UDP-N-acetylglucosamine 2-epimerase (non-hydrolysing)